MSISGWIFTSSYDFMIKAIDKIVKTMYLVRKYANVLESKKFEGTRKKVEMLGITRKDVSM